MTLDTRKITIWWCDDDIKYSLMNYWWYCVCSFPLMMILTAIFGGSNLLAWWLWWLRWRVDVCCCVLLFVHFYSLLWPNHYYYYWYFIWYDDKLINGVTLRIHGSIIRYCDDDDDRYSLSGIPHWPVLTWYWYSDDMTDTVMTLSNYDDDDIVDDANYWYSSR